MHTEPEKDTSNWQTLQGFRNKGMRVSDLGLEQPSESGDVFSEKLPQAYTFFTYIDEIKIDANHPLGLYLSFIGDNWEVYFNGNKLKSKLLISTRSKLIKHYFTNNLLIPIPENVFANQKNKLVFHIVGYPDSPYTGFFYGNDYLIDYYDNLVPVRYDFFRLLCILALLAVALYQFIFVFPSTRSKASIYFGLFCVSYSGYIANQTFIPTSLFPDLDITRLIPSTVMLAVAALTMLLQEIFKFKQRKLIIIAAIFWFALSILNFLISHSYIESIFILFTLSELPIALLLIINVYKIARKEVSKRLLQQEDKRSHIKALSHTLVFTNIGNFMIAIFLMIISVAFDSIIHHIFHFKLNITNYFVVLYLFIPLLAVSRRHETMSRHIENYRNLIDILNDLVFICHDRKIQFANEFAAIFFRKRETAAFIGQNIIHYLPLKERELILEALPNAQNKSVRKIFKDLTLYHQNTNYHIEIMVTPFTFNGKKCSHILIRDISIQIKANMERQRLLNMEKELAVVKERQEIYTDIHDHLGANLTDLVNMIREIDENNILPAYIKPLKLEIDNAVKNLRSRLQNIEDRELLQENFLQGLNLILLRRYNNLNQKLLFQYTESASEITKSIKFSLLQKSLYSVFTEICTNDLKYGTGKNNWSFDFSNSTLAFQMINGTNYYIDKASSGNGTENILRRVKDIGGEVNWEIKNDQFTITIRLKL